ncbi:MAG TPA: hypothetical protein VM889_10105, partial [Candidatus Thermoplasmatota archaeon]|nr:hypothetical protein [Candidatus Thermoplasmatota archaeon]
MDPKLRLVLDYVPCDQCLETPSADQEILCSVCRRLHREVAVKVTERREVVIERPAAHAPVAVTVPAAAAAPTLAPEAPPRPVDEAPAPVSHVEIVIGAREAGERVPGGPTTEVVLEDLEPAADAPAPVPAEAAMVATAPDSPFAEADFEASFTYVPLPRSALPPPPPPAADPEPAAEAAPAEAYTIE